jgi:trimethylamine:corrinoid methyltransferase-like protein
LAQRHTRQHMRQRWMPTLIDRRPYNVWEVKQDGARQWAGEKARQLLREYQPEPLAPALQTELQTIIAAAEKEFIS